MPCYEVRLVITYHHIKRAYFSNKIDSMSEAPDLHRCASECWDKLCELNYSRIAVTCIVHADSIELNI
jgi:hypothetical protein